MHVGIGDLVGELPYHAPLGVTERRPGGEARSVVRWHDDRPRTGPRDIGQLARERWGDDAYIIGFGTDHGTVAAATDWGGEMEAKEIRPSHERSYERVCHDAEVPAFLLSLTSAGRAELVEALSEPRLERAIGVVYRPETELQSHYFQAVLPRQFDEWIWFDRTEAVRPLRTAELAGVPDTYPFGL